MMMKEWLCVVPAGEMVVDDVDMETDEQRRRFLIYDVMLLGYEGVSDLRFAVSGIIIDPFDAVPR
jgi:hypothetical protein